MSPCVLARTQNAAARAPGSSPPRRLPRACPLEGKRHNSAPAYPTSSAGQPAPVGCSTGSRSSSESPVRFSARRRSSDDLRPREGENGMFLGTPRKWWFAAAVPLVLGFGLLATGDGTMIRTAAAVVLLLLAMVLFGMAPMRYGQSARTPPKRTVERHPAAPMTPITAIDAPRSRAPI